MKGGSIRRGLLLAVLLFPLSSWSVEGPASIIVGERPAVESKKVDLSRYALPEVDVKKAILLAMIGSNWTVVDQSQHQIRAQYKKAMVEAIITGPIVELREVQTDGGSFKYAWLETLEAYLLKDMEYRYQAAVAEKLSH